MGIILFTILLDASFGVVDTLALSPTSVQQQNQVNLGNILPAANCAQQTVSAAGLPSTCSNNLGVNQDIVGTVFTFGDFFWSFVKAFPLMVQGAIESSSLIGSIFGSVVVVWNIGIFFLLASWVWGFIGNRQTNPE